MENHFEHKYNREYDSIESLISAAVFYKIVKKDERDIMVEYLKDLYKDGWFYKPTDIRVDGNNLDLEVRVPLTLRALEGILEQRKEEINFMLSNKNSTTATKEIEIPDSILNALLNEELITLNPLQWNKDRVSLCAYFVDSYFAKSNPNDLWKIGENLFNVKYLRQSKNRYLGNKNAKPKDYHIIETILQTYK